LHPFAKAIIAMKNLKKIDVKWQAIIILADQTLFIHHIVIIPLLKSSQQSADRRAILGSKRPFEVQKWRLQNTSHQEFC
jgi:hypothetical protein